MNHPTHLSEQLVWRYVMGGCSSQEIRTIEATMAADAPTREFVQEIRAAHEAMQAQEESVLAEPVPQRLIDAVRRRGRGRS